MNANSAPISGWSGVAVARELVLACECARTAWIVSAAGFERGRIGPYNPGDGATGERPGIGSSIDTATQSESDDFDYEGWAIGPAATPAAAADEPNDRADSAETLDDFDGWDIAPISECLTGAFAKPSATPRAVDHRAAGADSQISMNALNATPQRSGISVIHTAPVVSTVRYDPVRSDDPADFGDSDSESDDFDSTEGFQDFTMPAPRTSEPQPIIHQSKATGVQAATVTTAGRQDTPSAAASAGDVGLTRTSQSGISITNMTQRDRPTELVRLCTNTSVELDLSGPVDAVNIVDPNIADIIVPTPTRVIVVGKTSGTTQLVLTLGQGAAQQHRVVQVYVEPNVLVLTDLIRSLAPRADVRVASLNGQLVLQGIVSDPITARQIEELARAYQGRDVINHLSVSGTQQTLLRVVVAEINKEALRNLGFNWAIGASDWSRDFFFANNVGSLNPTTFTSSGLANVLNGQQLYSVGAVGNGTNTNVTFGFPKAELQIFMNALRTNGLARTLAEPNLVAISGQTATFLAGGEVPIPVAQGGAVAGAITIEYKEFGVRLAFTPTVGADQIIRLHVMTEVSDAVPGSRQIDTIPVFTFRTRRVESTIECPNGKTFAIAGLLNESVNAIASKIPGLGDVPVLGQLFSSVDYQRSNTELVVLVTPHLVEALEPGQVPPVPGQLMQHPDDWELFGLGMLEGAAPPNRQQSSKPDSNQSENSSGTVVHAAPKRSIHSRLQGNWGIEEREPGALSD
ncbi:MAG: type II and III secretion system protein family protein [Phycisphaerae bacterium]|nr:type II and III secretion system protein family protein [Phycisphaerae bacterium]